ncbi:hypothetical protein QTP88_008146 [Uroleucon formosanum]
MLSALNVRSGTGPDGIPSSFLKASNQVTSMMDIVDDMLHDTSKQWMDLLGWMETCGPAHRD